MSTPPPRRHAIVIGASIGGLCAAEALAPHFDRVTLLERDALPDGPELRRGVPQGAHPHGLQMRGCRALESLFPGVLDGCVQEGGALFDPLQGIARLTWSGWLARSSAPEATSLMCSRPLLEWQMRKRLLEQRTNVRIVEKVKVTGLIWRRDGEEVWVEGTRLQTADREESELRADMVVDSTGRGTKALKWMSAMGLPRPKQIRVDPKSNYATRHYKAPEEARHWWWHLLLIDHVAPEMGRACLIQRVEKDRWIVTATGYDGDYAPTDEEGWLEYIKSTRSRAVYSLLRRATPISPVVQTRTTVNWWKRMHEYEGKLNGFLMFGDTVCGFNPSYGQGMTAAALAAECLRTKLDAHDGPLDRRFLRAYYGAQAKFLQSGWTLSTSMDLKWANAKGKRPLLHGLRCKLMKLVERVALADPYLLRKLVPFGDFGGSLWGLLTPGVLARFAFGMMRSLVTPPRLESSTPPLTSSATETGHPHTAPGEGRRREDPLWLR